MRVLAGDIGGTKTAIATVDIDRNECRVRRLVRYPSADYPGLEEIVQQFLSDEKSRPRAAGFGVAGPVRDGVAKITKLPWRLDVRTLSRKTRIPRVALVNDFQAAAAGIHYLRSRQLTTLVPGRGERGATVAILGAGTGLGQAGIVHRDGRAVIVASEGGHVDFGPRNAAEDGLVDFLRRRFGRATRDRILSGGGLALIYEYLKSYSPYDNVTAQAYPALLVTAGLNDPRVQYWEPAKWVAKLRALSTSGRDILFRIQMEAGHTGASGRLGSVDEEAQIAAWLVAAASQRR